MASESRRFKFTMFSGSSDTLDYRSYKFTKADRILLDRLLTEAVERHHHTGEPGAASETTPPPGPLVTVQSTGGTIPAGTTAFYRAAVVDTRGQEHLASQVVAAPTSPPIFAAHAPLLQPSVGPGTLLPGDYLYAVSAYTHENSQETEASRPANSSLNGIGSFSVFPPRPPSGSDGFNIYRKGPTDSELLYITSITRDEAVFVDDGAVAANRLRAVPTANTTNGHSSIVLDVDGLPENQTVKIYRTFNASLWDNSLLAWTAVLPVADTGQATREGGPLSTSAAVGSPPKVRLGADTEGTLPPALVPASTTATFAFPGPLTAIESPWQWISEFDDALVLNFRAVLGRGSTPAAQPVQVALERRSAASGTWEPYTPVAEISVAEQASPLTPVASDDTPSPHLTAGDALRVVIVQDGGGATPTDHDLVVTVTLAARHGSDTTTYTWET